MDAKDLNSLQEAYLGIYQSDEGYVPLRTSDKPYDDEGNPTDTSKWYKKKAKAESGVGMQRALSSMGVGDPIQNLSRGLAAQRRLDAMNRIDAEPESHRRSRAQGREESNRRLGRNRRRLQASFDRQHLERSLQKEEVDIYDIILLHLLDEGYAETPEAANMILANMSEGWKQELEEFFFGGMREKEIQRAKEERVKKKKARKASESESKPTGKDPWSTHPSDAKMHAKEDR